MIPLGHKCPPLWIPGQTDWMPRAKRPLCNRQFLVALIPHMGDGGWICCINNSIPFQEKPEEGWGIRSIEFHDRSVLMRVQAWGIYLFIHSVLSCMRLHSPPLTKGQCLNPSFIWGSCSLLKMIKQYAFSHKRTLASALNAGSPFTNGCKSDEAKRKTSSADNSIPKPYTFQIILVPWYPWLSKWKRQQNPLPTLNNLNLMPRKSRKQANTC